jgi:hypothetical protein
MIGIPGHLEHRIIGGRFALILDIQRDRVLPMRQSEYSLKGICARDWFGAPQWKRHGEARLYGGMLGAPIQIEGKARVIIVPSGAGGSLPVDRDTDHSAAAFTLPP